MPEGWEWCRLTEITFEIFAGGDKPENYSKTQTDEFSIPIFANGAENDGLYGFTNKARVNKSAITVSARGTIGFCCIRHMPFVPIVRLITIVPAEGINIEYLRIVFQALIETGEGSSIPQLTVPGIKPKLIPIPPYSEQTRISNKLIETEKIVSAVELNQESVVNYIKLAKAKILDLAIRGQLVPQDPNDEPALVLLERIRAEKEELIKAGKIKRDKKESIIFRGDDNSYYGIHLPDSWNWASLREIALSISDGSHNPPPNNGSGIPLLSAANINDNSILMNEISRWITNEEWKIENQRTNIEVGDVLLTIVGSIGRSAVVQNNNHFALQRSVAVIKPCLINPLYLMHIVQSPQIQKWLTDNSKGTAQKGIYLNALSLMIIPIPPLAEQARIVELIHIAYKQLDLISNALL